MNLTKVIYCIILLPLVYSCKTSNHITEQISTFRPTVPQSYLSIEEALDFFELDEFGNIYLIKDYTIQLYDANQNFKYSFSNNRFGNITAVDVSNPQKIVVYFQDFDMVFYLDNNLSEIKRMDLKNWDLFDTKTVASSNDNFLWLYDQNNYQLKKINGNGKVLTESLSLLYESSGTLHPNKIIAHGNFVYLFDNYSGLYVFDNLGQFIKKHSLALLKDLQLYNNNVIYNNDDGYFLYELAYQSTVQLEGLDEQYKTKAKSIKISVDKYYLGFDNGIFIGIR